MHVNVSFPFNGWFGQLCEMGKGRGKGSEVFPKIHYSNFSRNLIVKS